GAPTIGTSSNDARRSVNAADDTRRGRRPGTSRRADLDSPVSQPGLEPGLRRRGRPLHNRAVEPEGAAVAAAPHGVADERAFVERTAAVRAPVAERVDGLAAPHEQNGDVSGIRPDEPVLAEPVR